VNVLAPQTALAAYLVRLGDNALILGQQLAASTGHGPIVEEDLATANVALDLIGQARLWLALAGEVEGAGRSADDFAYLRDPAGFRNLLLVERPSDDFAHATVRGFLFDTWHFHLLRALAESSDERVAAIAAKAVREVEYHARRSGDWVVRLGDGTAESNARVQAAVRALWPNTGELFASDEVDAEIARAGIGPAAENLREPWRRHVAEIFADATLDVPADGWMHAGGRSGRHSEAFSYLIAEMQSVRRSVPGERW
jgi:ring-1,2-phenylacetyl-CoA epoxidase subunit PaaC